MCTSEDRESEKYILSLAFGGSELYDEVVRLDDEARIARFMLSPGTSLMDYSFADVDVYEAMARQTLRRSKSKEAFLKVVESRTTIDSAESLFAKPRLRASMISRHLAHNRLGRIAPYFRNFLGEPLRKSGRSGSELTQAERCLSLDLQVIDIHWIIRRRLDSNPYSHICIGEHQVVDFGKIRWPAIVKVATSNQTSGRKILDLKITDFEQLQLNKIHKPSIRNKKRTIRQKEKEIRDSILNLASRPKSQIPLDEVDTYTRQWLALSLTGGVNAEAVKLNLVMPGTVCDSKTMYRRKAWFKEKSLLND